MMDIDLMRHLANNGISFISLPDKILVFVVGSNRRIFIMTYYIENRGICSTEYKLGNGELNIPKTTEDKLNEVMIMIHHEGVPLI